MIEQALKQILEFFKSPEFTAIVTSLAAVVAIIYPLIRPFLKAKTEAKIQHAITQASIIAKNYDELKDKYLEQARQADILLAELKQQREAIRIAFDQSNLRYDVKEKVTSLLKEVKPVEVIKAKEEPILELKEVKQAPAKEEPVKEELW